MPANDPIARILSDKICFACCNLERTEHTPTARTADLPRIDASDEQYTRKDKPIPGNLAGGRPHKIHLLHPFSHNELFLSTPGTDIALRDVGRFCAALYAVQNDAKALMA